MALIQTSQPQAIDDPWCFSPNAYQMVPSRPAAIDDPLYNYGAVVPSYRRPIDDPMYNYGALVPTFRLSSVDDPFYSYGTVVPSSLVVDDPFYGYGYGNFARWGPYRHAVDRALYSPLSRGYKPSSSYMAPSLQYSKYAPPMLNKPSSADYLGYRRDGLETPYGSFVAPEFQPHKGVMHFMNHLSVLWEGKHSNKSPYYQQAMYYRNMYRKRHYF